MDQAQLVDRAKSLIDELSQTPRFAGSAEESRARARCRLELERAGFTCREIPFDYSQWLGRWGPPLVYLVAAALVVFLAQFTLRFTAWAGLAYALVPWAFAWLAVAPLRGSWVLSFRWSRTLAVNLEATRGSPLVWLVAHLDTKSQTMPMLLRIVGSVAVQSAGFLVIIGTLAFLIWGKPATPLLIAAQLLAGIGAIPVVLCLVGNNSSGAVDNASGVATVLLAAQAAEAPASLGVLITSGEELGLAGALAWAGGAPDHLVVLNCDTIDEVGSFRCMYTGSQPMRVAVVAENQAKRLGMHLKVGRMIPGIMADSMVFASDNRRSAITLSRGSLATLARIHTRGDNSSKLTGEGAAQASALLSAMARELS